MASCFAATALFTPSSVPDRTFLSTKTTFSYSSSHSSFFANTFKPSTLLLARRNRPTHNNKNGFSCNCLFGLGVPELVVIAGVVALVFGPKKLPEVGRSIGKTVKSFQQAAKEFETELKKEPETMGDSSDVTVVNEQEPEDLKVPSTKESL